jgi:hypothetical protein
MIWTVVMPRNWSCSIAIVALFFVAGRIFLPAVTPAARLSGHWDSTWPPIYIRYARNHGYGFPGSLVMK